MARVKHARSRAFSSRVDRRGLWLARAERSRLFGVVAVPPQFALRREQGGQRSSGAGVRYDLWNAGPDNQLFEQLRPLPAPREIDSADDHSRTGGKAAADLWGRFQRPGL